MMDVPLKEKRVLSDISRTGNALFLQNGDRILRLEAYSNNVFRVSFSFNGVFDKRQGEEYLTGDGQVDWDYRDNGESVSVCSEKIRLSIDKESGSISFFNKDGALILRERGDEPRECEEVKLYKTVNTGDIEVEEVVTADGVKKKVKAAERLFDKSVYRTRNYFEFDDEENLYGFGQGARGEWNLRNTTYYLYQANRKIAIPMMISDKGYGILLSTQSAAFFSENEKRAYIQTEADYYLDYYFILGENLFDVIKGYRRITGKAAMLPKWCYGYIQSQERYESQDEILKMAQEFRTRGIGVDCLVLDWLSWEEGMWGQKSFDFKRFPDPSEMVKQLHDKNIHFMISIWPNMSPNTRDNAEFKEKGLLFPGTDIYDAFSERGRKLYWSQVHKNLFSHGIDAWWCDSCEPITPEWEHQMEPCESEAYLEFKQEAFNIMPGDKANAYAFYHALTVWEGQRKACKKRRVVNLTRSGWAGSQKYGTILWSGDISASWECLKNQVKAGLQFAMSGMPYWTLDVGAFFVKKGRPWYWNGEFEDGITEDYKKLYVRWLEFAMFLPVFRAHGTDVRREPWAFGDEKDIYYRAIVNTIQERYRLLPYLYSLGAAAAINDGMIIRPLFFDFAMDKKTRNITDQFMLGDSLMVCPVITADDTRDVYLPAGRIWYDYYTDKKYEGGQVISYEAPIDRIPVFVPGGSIIPVTEPKKSTAGKYDSVEVRVYPGKDCSFELYDDAGDGYDYENGSYGIVRIEWDDEKKEISKSNTGDNAYVCPNIEIKEL